MFVLEELREKPKSQATFSKCMHDWIQPEKMTSYMNVWSFRFFYWLFEWFTHSFKGNLAVYEQGFVPLNSCLVEQILVFIWHLVIGSGTHWKINLEIASSYARLGMFPTALIFLILECRHEPVMKQKLPTKKTKQKKNKNKKKLINSRYLSIDRYSVPDIFKATKHIENKN